MSVTVRVAATASGELCYRARGRVRYVSASLAGTVTETRALRELIGGRGGPASLSTRAPGHWPTGIERPTPCIDCGQPGHLPGDWSCHLRWTDEGAP